MMSSPPDDPYKALGVSRDAQIAEIRSAHRKLVLKCHPDKVQDPELKAQKQDEFQKVQEAYEILSDEVKRQKCDDMLKLAELRKQRDGRANTSAPRSASKMYAEFEIRTAEPRPSTFRSAPPPPPAGVKIYPAYSKSWDDEKRAGARYYEADVRTPRREKSYSDKPSKREVEREREREKEREKEREREKRRARKEREAEDLRRAAKKEEKRAKEKQRSKEHKREKEEKRRERDDPYIESFDEEPPPLLRKSGTKRYDERRERERSAPLEDPPVIPAMPTMPSMPPMPTMPTMHQPYMEEGLKSNFARAYIKKSQGERSHSYHGHSGSPQMPQVPMPPPAGSIYAAAEDEEILRSSARSRRGSAADIPSSSGRRERTYHRSSRDHTGSPVIVDTSPGTRGGARFSGPPPVLDPSTPPRNISRTHTMPAELPTRPMPAPRRAQTFDSHDNGAELPNRGRGRSKMTPQVEESSSDSEDEYVERSRRKHRSSRKTRSPEAIEPVEIRYAVDGGRARRMAPSATASPYAHTMEPEKGYHYIPQRPSYSRDASYVGASFPKVNVSKPVTPSDVQYSSYHAPAYRDELSSVRG